MVFTLEQEKFLIMSYYRDGVKRGGELTYSVKIFKQEFFCTPVVEYKHSDSGFRYGVTHILELLQNIYSITC
jgi:hypothetical protein